MDGRLEGTGTLLSNAAVSGNVRVEGDVRGNAAGLVMGHRSARNQIVAWLDGASRRLVVDVTVAGQTTSSYAPLPANFNYRSWHTVVLERRGPRLAVEVSADRLRDAVASVSVALPDGIGNGQIGAIAVSGTAQAANLGAAPLYTPVTRRVSDPAIGRLLSAYSDEFNGSAPGAGWSWVRGDPGVSVAGGSLVWPTQAAELALGANTASVLVREAPAGDFVVETKLQFDGVRGNQQAGLVLYDNDDRFVKLVHSVLPLNNGGGAVLHQTEFTKEDTRASTGQVFAGPMFGGPATPTLWLRMLYRGDTVRMASSRDGFSWEWGGYWALPRRSALKIGLVSMNALGATGTFDYVNVSRA